MSIHWRVSEREHPQKCHFLYFLERPLQQFCTTVQTAIAKSLMSRLDPFQAEETKQLNDVLPKSVKNRAWRSISALSLWIIHRVLIAIITLQKLRIRQTHFRPNVIAPWRYRQCWWVTRQRRTWANGFFIETVAARLSNGRATQSQHAPLLTSSTVLSRGPRQTLEAAETTAAADDGNLQIPQRL